MFPVQSPTSLARVPLARVPAVAAGLVASAILALAVTLPTGALAQNFVAQTDSANSIVAESVSGNYTGAAWVDVDDDGLLDLFMARKGGIHHNQGNGQFTKVANIIQGQGTGVLGTTWSDYDNDGDIDCYVIGGPAFLDKGAMLYRNEGNFTFTRITTGDIGDTATNNGWGGSFGDIDNDGYTDIVIAAANGFNGVFHENRLLYNNGDGTFTNVDSSEVVAMLDAHTIPTFSDYDLDGDIDLFIGSGQISSLDPDNLFENQLIDTGTWEFTRITTAPIATDSLDGQVWNWIDYYNDGDLDAFQTNYNASLANKLYRNDSGTYVAMTQTDVGTIVSDSNAGLANLWGDFDNDGDLDCFVTNDGGATNDYFVNNGDGTFTQDLATPAVQNAGPHYGATAADYDNDGDLDLYVHGNNTTKTLYRNDLAAGNGFVNVKLVGAGAPGGTNVSALGARVRVKATINGTPVWQMREVSAQNSFNSMNMLNVHVGLGNATVIDSLEISWPAGGVQVFTNVPLNRFYRFVEGEDPTGVELGAASSSGLRLLPNRPNPFDHATQVTFDVARAGDVKLGVYDVGGRLVKSLWNGRAVPGRHAADWDGRDASGRSVAAGVYLVRLESSGETDFQTRKMILLR
ncbi:MAG: hypothetical protein HKN12_00315 [Gemmatimonadetes bacterium]|nr:hypothetical protein [Gemmatimonadota bacterium]